MWLPGPPPPLLLLLPPAPRGAPGPVPPWRPNWGPYLLGVETRLDSRAWGTPPGAPRQELRPTPTSSLGETPLEAPAALGQQRRGLGALSLVFRPRPKVTGWRVQVRREPPLAGVQGEAPNTGQGHPPARPAHAPYPPRCACSRSMY